MTTTRIQDSINEYMIANKLIDAEIWVVVEFDAWEILNPYQVKRKEWNRIDESKVVDEAEESGRPIAIVTDLEAVETILNRKHCEYFVDSGNMLDAHGFMAFQYSVHWNDDYEEFELDNLGSWDAEWLPNFWEAEAEDEEEEEAEDDD